MVYIPHNNNCLFMLFLTMIQKSSLLQSQLTFYKVAALNQLQSNLIKPRSSIINFQVLSNKFVIGHQPVGEFL